MTDFPTLRQNTYSYLPDSNRKSKKTKRHKKIYHKTET